MMGFDLGTVAVLLFAAGAFLAAYAVQALFVERHEVYRTLRMMPTYEIESVQVRQQDLAPSFARRVVIPVMLRLGRFARRVVPLASADRIRRELQLAGNPDGWDAERVLAAKVVSAVGGALSAPLFAQASGAGFMRSFAIVLLFAAVGYYVPDQIVRSRGRRRQAAIRRELPDTLDLLAISVEAGLGFDAALTKIAARSPGPLAEELNRVLREIQLGKPRSDALRDLAERSALQELKSFVLSTVQAESFGISVGRVLKVQAREMRVKRRQRAEEAAQKIPVKIVFPLVFCILPTLFTILLGPAAINIYGTLIGR